MALWTGRVDEHCVATAAGIWADLTFPIPCALCARMVWPDWREVTCMSGCGLHGAGAGAGSGTSRRHMLLPMPCLLQVVFASRTVEISGVFES